MAQLLDIDARRRQAALFYALTAAVLSRSAGGDTAGMALEKALEAAVTLVDHDSIQLRTATEALLRASAMTRAQIAEETQASGRDPCGAAIYGAEQLIRVIALQRSFEILERDLAEAG